MKNIAFRLKNNCKAKSVNFKRGNMKKIFTVFITVFILCFSLVSCSIPRRAGDIAKEEGTYNIDKKNTLIYAQSAEPRGLDPALVDDGESAKVIANIYEGLLKYASDSTQVEPCLAETWEISEDQMTYTFHLRRGVKFHDGTDFNADAVKFNIDRQLQPNATEDMGYATFVYGSMQSGTGVKEVRVIDDYTVAIDMNSPNSAFLNNLAMIISAPMVSPKALQENNNNVNEHPCGTGPYKFLNWTKGQNIVLTRNEDYWGEKAKTQSVIFKFIADNSARVVALNNGEADIIDGIDATVVEQIQAAGDKIYETEGMMINYLAYNTTREPFNRVEIRRAFNQAINVPELVNSLYQGYAQPAVSVMPSFIPGYNNNVERPPFNQADAKKVLESAQIEQVHMITYTNARPYNPANGQVLAEAIQGYLRNIGINATIDAYDWATYKEKIKTGDYDICFYGWTGDNGDADNFMSLLADEDPTLNVARWENENYRQKLREGLTMPAGESRNLVYQELEQMVADEAVWLPISHAKILCGYKQNVKNFTYHMTGVVFLKDVYKE